MRLFIIHINSRMNFLILQISQITIKFFVLSLFFYFSICALGICNPASAEDRDLEWKLLIDHAEKLYHDHDYDAAMDAATKATHIAADIGSLYYNDHVRQLRLLVELLKIKNEYAAAKTLANRLLDIQKEHSGGKYHSDAIDTLIILSRIYRIQGDYKNAENVLKPVLEMNQKGRFLTDLDTLAILSNLSLTYEDSGSYSNAEKYARQVVALNKKIAPNNIRRTQFIVDSIEVLERLYRRQGENIIADVFRNQAWAMRMAIFVSIQNSIPYDIFETKIPKHENTVNEFHNKITEFEIKNGSNNIHLTSILNDIALDYINIADYDKARNNLQRALNLQEKTIGLDHIFASNVMYNLAGVYNILGQYETSILLLKRSIAIRQKWLGDNDIKVAQYIENLGILYKKQDKITEANNEFIRADEINKKLRPLQQKKGSINLDDLPDQDSAKKRTESDDIKDIIRNLRPAVSFYLFNPKTHPLNTSEIKSINNTQSEKTKQIPRTINWGNAMEKGAIGGCVGLFFGVIIEIIRRIKKYYKKINSDKINKISKNNL